MQVTRAARWTNFFDTLYQVEKSSRSVPGRSADRLSGGADLGRAVQSPQGPLRLDGLEGHGRSGAAHRESAAVAVAQQPASTSPIRRSKKSSTSCRTTTAFRSSSTQPALEEIGVGTDEPVTINLHNVSLRSALRLMLKKLQLTYIIQDEVLMITTPEEAEKQSGREGLPGGRPRAAD